MVLATIKATTSHQRVEEMPAAATKNLPMKPSVSGMPASDSSAAVKMMASHGLRQKRPR